MLVRHSELIVHVRAACIRIRLRLVLRVVQSGEKIL
jgi:hypothetical protein